ncbi:MAG: hypothetical protein QOJ89_3140 [bacterium]|jgi:transglutaminase-like putative cysteine protease
MTATYRITHRTTYEYASDVSSSYGRLHLLPRDLDRQRCVSSSLEVDPAPDDQSELVDFFGNRVAYVAIHERHRELSVTATSVVEVDERAGLPLFAQCSWEEVRDAARGAGDDAVDAMQFVLDSPLVKASENFAAFAQPSFLPGAPISEAVVDLASRIHDEFEFEAGETKIDTPLEEVLAGRKGVCQDFAHVAIACLRSLGLPARYVSGYLETDPPPGRPKLMGADVSHAWFSVPVPGAGWLDVDPTNDQVVNERYVVNAYGRDYSDVAPVTGIIYTRGRTKSLDVVVDVTAV